MLINRKSWIHSRYGTTARSQHDNHHNQQRRDQLSYHKAKIVVLYQVFAIVVNLLAPLVKLADTMAIDHCYSDIGCFPLSEEFYHPRHRPFNVRPWHRRLINTHFLLFNRQHPNGFRLEPLDKQSLMASHFNPSLETKIIIPGWLDNIRRALWVKRLKDSLLWLWHPVNIIVVHWRNFTPYTIATANTRVVGAELANLLRWIEIELNYDRSYHHLIGHSLGAHISGYCGDRLPGLGRITALDPARPFFQHMPKSVRLDRGDAKFVDAIHSDFTPENAILLLMSFGMTTPVGHLDFYPNGPSLLQPGCLRDTILSIQNGIMRGLEHSSLSVAFLEATRYLTACDHQRSHEWFIESITNRQCTFVGVRCNEFEGLINGRCTCDDSPSACAVMGIHADQMYLHNLHEDIWPLGQQGTGRIRVRRHNTVAAKVQVPTEMHPPSIQTLARPVQVRLDATFAATKDDMRSKLKHDANYIRQHQKPRINYSPKAYDEEINFGLDHMEDVDFVKYLRSNILPQQVKSSSSLKNQQKHHPSFQKSRPKIDSEVNEDEWQLGRRFTSPRDAYFDEELEMIFHGNNVNPPINKHPKLLSDFDRDVENWYEDSSRWFLKTANKPNYCVNQYQIIIYLGPLKTTNGHKHLRANLIVSIIGSRGELINQKFIPRSAKLDSFTMQPFFVILEGTYSLGNILSVAVGWEARIDPDPVQATISFQSDILESLQATVPEIRLRPILSKTLGYDHSSGFQGHRFPLIENRRRSVADQVELSRRSSETGSEESRCLPDSLETSECQLPDDDLLHEAESESQVQTLDDIMMGLDKFLTDDILGSKEVEYPIQSASTSDLVLVAPLSTAQQDNRMNIESQIQNQHRQLHLSPRKSDNRISPMRLEVDIPVMPGPIIAHQVGSDGKSLLSANFHNIPNLHHITDNLEDSIIINKIVVSPLQANYGKGMKQTKVFCPIRLERRLRRDQTIRLLPNVLDDCQVGHRYG